jgi:hypothetical protein
MKTIAIIPLISDTLHATERQSLTSLKKIMNEVDICFIGFQKVYDSLFEALINIFPDSNFKFESFSEEFFASVKSYNFLMITTSFYQRFLDYDYMLIFQLDAYIIQNNLDEFLHKNFVYLGAPWFGIHSNIKGLIIGNGGLSLRNVEFFHNSLNNNQLFKEKLWLSLKPKSRFRRFSLDVILGFCINLYSILVQKNAIFELGKLRQQNEDIIWSNYIKKQKITKPTFEDGLAFSFDKLPETCYAISNHKLPFGCHGFSKNNPSFWRKIIPDAFN